MKILMGADFHFRSSPPEARLDDYLESQQALMDWLRDTSKGYDLFLNSGDIVDSARERKDPLGWANYLAKNIPIMTGVLGNHDLLYHTTDTLDSTTMGTLINFGKYNVLKELHFLDQAVGLSIYGFSYGEEIKNCPKKPEGVAPRKDHVNICVYHGMVMEEPNPFFGGLIAKDMLAEFSNYDIILTGDNHKTFIVENEGRVLINPGSLKRDNASQLEHKPVLFTFDTDLKIMDKIEVPIENDILSREHLTIEKERDERIEALGEKFKEVQNITLEYDKNLEEFFQINNTQEDIQCHIYKWMEGDNA